MSNSNLGPYLDIKQACILTGKSESTIRRLVKELGKKPKSKYLAKKYNGDKYNWLISKQFLVQNYNLYNNKLVEESAKSITLLEQELKEKNNQIELLEKQLLKNRVGVDLKVFKNTFNKLFAKARQVNLIYYLAVLGFTLIVLGFVIQVSTS
jgi:predicted RNase H-like nuclease (RuvC/YqgF family)